MSDDDNNRNASVTLPNGQDATYNLGLSPLFANRGARSGPMYDKVSVWSGFAGFYWSACSHTKDSAYYLSLDDHGTQSSNFWNNPFAFSLRCLVSTTNSCMINLVSDDDKNGAWDANQGVNLPGNDTAVYNASLTPIFTTYSGNIRLDTKEGIIENHLSSFGKGGYAWSRSVFGDYWEYGSYFLSISYGGTYPSSRHAQTFANPLRCLVSTTNSYMIRMVIW